MKMLTRKGFREWLEGKKPGEHVAPRDWRGKNCPIANFIRTDEENLEVFAWGVFPRGLKEYPKGKCIPLPKWAEKFVNAVDKYGYGKNSEYRKCARLITARRALKILSSIK